MHSVIGGGPGGVMQNNGGGIGGGGGVGGDGVVLGANGGLVDTSHDFPTEVAGGDKGFERGEGGGHGGAESDSSFCGGGMESHQHQQQHYYRPQHNGAEQYELVDLQQLGKKLKHHRRTCELALVTTITGYRSIYPVFAAFFIPKLENIARPFRIYMNIKG